MKSFSIGFLEHPKCKKTNLSKYYLVALMMLKFVITYLTILDKNKGNVYNIYTVKPHSCDLCRLLVLSQSSPKKQDTANVDSL